MLLSVIEDVDCDGHQILSSIEAQVRKQILDSVVFDFPQVLMHSLISVVCFKGFINLFEGYYFLDLGTQGSDRA